LNIRHLLFSILNIGIKKDDAEEVKLQKNLLIFIGFGLAFLGLFGE
jgi:hypothetical protein